MMLLNCFPYKINELVKDIGTIELVTLVTALWALLTMTFKNFKLISPIMVLLLRIYIYKIRKLKPYKHFIVHALEYFYNIITLSGSQTISEINAVAMGLIMTSHINSNDNVLYIKCLVLLIIKMSSYLTDGQINVAFTIGCFIVTIITKKLVAANVILEYALVTMYGQNENLLFAHTMYALLCITSTQIYYEGYDYYSKYYFGDKQEQSLIIGPIVLRILCQILCGFCSYFVGSSINLFGLVFMGYTGLIFYIMNKGSNYDTFTGFRKKILCPGLWNGYTSSSVSFLIAAAKQGDIIVGVYDYDDYEYYKKHCKKYNTINMPQCDQSFIMANKVRLDIMSNIKCVKDAIVIPVEITPDYLANNDYDYVVYPANLKTKLENGIIEQDLINKFIV